MDVVAVGSTNVTLALSVLEVEVLEVPLVVVIPEGGSSECSLILEGSDELEGSCSSASVEVLVGVGAIVSIRLDPHCRNFVEVDVALTRL